MTLLEFMRSIKGRTKYSSEGVIQTVTIGERLPSLNDAIRWKRTPGKGTSQDLYSINKGRLEGRLALAMRAARLVPLDSAHFGFYWIEPDKRRDPDNIISGKKFLLDALRHAGVLKKDGWSGVLSIADHWQIGDSASVTVVMAFTPSMKRT